jgi:23S rRNA (uracil1939-C5)-methyltransferase
VLNINQSKGNIILSDKCVTIWGKDVLEDSLLGIRYRYSPLSFLQVNPEQAGKLYSQVLEFSDLKGSETVLDAYCGIGIMTLLLAKRAKHTIGVEIVPQAIHDAQENAELNAVNNVEFFSGDCAKLLPELTEKGLSPDVAVVDPPPAGCEEATLQAIARAKVSKLIYVSCDPATLARDLAILAPLGYEVKKIVCVDMFAMTGHVETVVLMSRVEGE